MDEKTINNENNLKFAKFEDIPVSTKTFIVMTNLTLDIQKMHDFLPITDYIIVQKKRGRKKKITITDPNRNLPNGSIITLDLANNVRGVSLKKKRKKDGKAPDYFRNSMTVVMIIDGKRINFKVSRNGKFQMTGCKFDIQAEECVKQIWMYIKDNPELYKINDLFGKKKKGFRALFIPAMRNIDFNLGFVLDREQLDKYFNEQTEYYSLLETSIGYTGVNIKIPVKTPITDLKIKEICYLDNEWQKPKLTPFETYLSQLKPKERQKKLEKERFNTFLVFHSGKIIMSAMCEEFARESYDMFLDIIKNNYELFRERLEN